MTLMLVFNVILGLGVAAMVIAPLVWAIRTQVRDLPAAGEAAGSIAGAGAQAGSGAHRRASGGAGRRPRSGALQSALGPQ